MPGMQFKITLQDVNPPIWRRIIVPENYSFWDFHVAIQDSMGWTDTHLHSFQTMPNSRSLIGIPSPDGDDFMEIKAGWKIKLKDTFNKTGKKVRYEYDFGDGWEHEIKFEKEIEKEIKKPKCLEGEGACPPEDCGGPGGFEQFCEIMRTKKGKEYTEMKEWYGKDFDPNEFDPKEVIFDNPKERLNMLQEF
jgi:hypothetical protein